MATEAGYSYVSIVPSAEGFAEKLQSQVDPAAEKVGGRAGDLAGKAFSDALTAEVSGASFGDPSSSGGTEAGTKAADQFRSALEAGIAGSDVTAKVGLDETDLQTKIDALKAKLDELGAKDEHPKVSVDTGDSEAKLAVLDRSLADTSGSAGNASGGLSSLLKLGVLLGPALLPVAGVATGAFIGLSGAVGAAGIGLGALALVAKPVLSAVNTAANAQQTYNNAVAAFGPASTQAKAALRALTLAQQEMTPAEIAAAAAMSGFKDQLQTWQQSFDPLILPLLAGGLDIARTAMGNLTPVISASGGALLGVEKQFEATFSSPAVTQGLKAFAGQASAGIGSLGPILANIVPAALNLFQAMSPLTTIVEGFLTHLGPELPALASSLAAPFQTLAGLLQTVGPLLNQLLGPNSVLSAAFAVLLPPLEKLGVAILQAVVPALAALVPAVAPVVAALGAGLLVVVRALAPILPTLVTAFGGLLKAVAPLVAPVAQLVAVLGAGLGQVLVAVARALTPLIGPLVQVATILLDSFLPVIKAMVGPIGVLAAALGAALGPVVKALVPVAESLAAAVAKNAPLFGLLVAAVIPLLAPLSQILVALIPLLPPLIQLAVQSGQAAAFIQILTPVVKFLADILAWLAPIVSDVVGWVTALIGPTDKASNSASTLGWIFKTLAPIFAEAVNAISGVVSFFVGIPADISAAWSAVAGFFSGLWSTVTKAFSDGVNAVVQFFVDLPGRILGAIVGIGKWLYQKGLDLIWGILTGIWDEAKNIWAWFGALKDTIVGLIVNAYYWIYDEGGKLIKGFGDGIVNAAGAVWQFLTGIPSNIKNLFVNAYYWLVDAGWAMIRGFGDAITNAIPGVHSILSGLSNLIPSWKGPPEKDAVLLYGAGQLIMGGLITGIGSKTEDLHRSLTDVSGVISGWTAAAAIPPVGGPNAPGGWAGSSGQPLIINVDARGAANPAAVQAAGSAGVMAVVPVLRRALLQGVGV